MGSEKAGVGFDALAITCAALCDPIGTEGDEWIDQTRSPLIGHCATVRFRIEAGLPGARVEGDRYLLSTAALAEEMQNGNG